METLQTQDSYKMSLPESEEPMINLLLKLALLLWLLSIVETLSLIMLGTGELIETLLEPQFSQVKMQFKPVFMFSERMLPPMVSLSRTLLETKLNGVEKEETFTSINLLFQLMQALHGLLLILLHTKLIHQSKPTTYGVLVLTQHSETTTFLPSTLSMAQMLQVLPLPTSIPFT